MRLTLIAVTGLLIVAGATSSSPAVIFDDTARYIKRGYHRNVDWPWPYICPDRAAVREPFAIMVNNGWRRQNLLGAHHFTPDGSKLSEAGELKVRWIVTQAPPDRRDIFVERSVDPSVTQQRVVATRSYAGQVSIDGQMPQVTETYLVSEGRPAAAVDAVNVKFQESMRPPVLPAATQISE